MTPTQANAVKANTGDSAADASVMLVSVVFAGLLLWWGWALRTGSSPELGYLNWIKTTLTQVARARSC